MTRVAGMSRRAAVIVRSAPRREGAAVGNTAAIAWSAGGQAAKDEALRHARRAIEAVPGHGKGDAGDHQAHDEPQQPARHDPGRQKCKHPARTNRARYDDYESSSEPSP